MIARVMNRPGWAMEETVTTLILAGMIPVLNMGCVQSTTLPRVTILAHVRLPVSDLEKVLLFIFSKKFQTKKL